MDKVLVQEFKTALEEERQRLTKELGAIARPNPKVKGDWTATFPKYEEGERVENSDLEESADEVEDYEVRRETEHALEERLAAVNAAIERITEEKYGVSTKTGNPLPIEQLRANPAASYEVELDEPQS